MFYSHEILTSQQYGVATIWLVATIGPKSSTRKVTRKAILEVDVPKACETIGQPPGAPIALRLQGNLLYGVSRVYEKQCGYVLTDAEKVHTHMRTFFNMFTGSHNAIDLNAGKSKRNQLMLPDDPNFDLDLHLPAFQIDEHRMLFATPHLTQGTNKTSSQLSPLRSGASSSGGQSLISGFDLGPSLVGGSLHLPSPFGHGNVDLPKHEDNLNIFGDDDIMMPLDDLGFEVDADGNIHPVVQQPELPALPQVQAAVSDGDLHPPESEHPVSGAVRPRTDDEGDVFMNLDPDAVAFSPRRQAHDEVAAAAPVRRAKPKPKLIEEDDETRISRSEFQDWNDNYLEYVEEACRPTINVSVAQARRNADDLIFNLGIADIGMPTGIPGVQHPLAELFSGAALRKRLIGIESVDEKGLEHRGRRRSASEVFGEDEAERRVRQRMDDDGQQLGRMDDGDLPVMMGDEGVEIGREPGSALSDQHLSLPWNRPPSVAPGSSVRSKTGGAGGSLQGRQVSSPLVGRGSVLHDIERMSDGAPAAFGSDGFATIHPQNSSFFDGFQPGDIATYGQDTSQAARDALSLEGKNFLDFVSNRAAEIGTSRSAGGDVSGRRWLDFEDLFDPADETKATAAQAFYHVLSLVTQGAMKVEQVNEGVVPFGSIRLGVISRRRVLEEADMGGEDDDDDYDDDDYAADDEDVSMTGLEAAAAGGSAGRNRSLDDSSDIYDL